MAGDDVESTGREQGDIEWPEDLYEMLDLIRSRPAMYIGTESLGTLETWLSGFLFARKSAGLPLLANEEEFSRFDQFVQDHYDWHDVGGWVAKIEYYERNGKHAIAEFYRLLDLFRGQGGSGK